MVAAWFQSVFNLVWKIEIRTKRIRKSKSRTSIETHCIEKLVFRVTVYNPSRDVNTFFRGPRGGIFESETQGIPIENTNTGIAIIFYDTGTGSNEVASNLYKEHTKNKSVQYRYKNNLKNYYHKKNHCCNALSTSVYGVLFTEDSKASSVLEGAPQASEKMEFLIRK